MTAPADGHPAPLDAERAGASPPVSIVVLTLNEEVNMRDCLASCAWSDDVHVLDSGSEDRTVEISQEFGAGTHFNRFESFGKQRNWAIDNIPLKHEWVFHLDADERFTPELVREIGVLLSEDPPFDGFHVPHKLMFMGRWLRRSGGYPTYQMRLFHKERMRFIDYGHGQREDPDARVGKLAEPYLHHVFSKGLYDWFEKHNRYSSLEALQAVTESGPRLSIPGLFALDPIVRRRSWKTLAYKLPFRPTLRYLATMLILGGITEGKAGRTHAQLMATYEQMIALKLRLLRNASGASHGAFEKDVAHTASTKVFRVEGEREAVAKVSGAQTPTREPDPSPASGPKQKAPIDYAARDRERLADAAEHPTDETGQLLPEASPWTFKEKLGRAIWMLVGRPLFALTFHNWYGVRNSMLRLFGASVGEGVRVRPSVHVEVPWNIELHDGAVIGDHAILYSLGRITVGERTIVSQYAHLCAGTHDHTDRRFPLIRDPIVIGRDAWIGADAYVGPNVCVGDLSVLGARSSAYKDLDPSGVYVGNPSKKLKERELR